MTEPKPIDPPEGDPPISIPDLAVLLAVCPFIGLYNDAQTHSMSSAIENYCHIHAQRHAIRSEYQAKVCLSAFYNTCPIYENHQNSDSTGVHADEFPEYAFYRDKNRQFRNQAQHFWRHRRNRIIVYITTLLLLALAGLAWIIISNSGALSSGAFPTNSPIPLTVTVPIRLTPLGLAATPQPLLTDQPSAEPSASSHSSTPHLLISPQPTHTLTPGPLAETPFGRAPVGDGPMLIHVAKPGESWDLLARQYDTTVPVLQVVNPRKGQQSVWEGEPLVILPGIRDTTGLAALEAKWVDGHWEIVPS